MRLCHLILASNSSRLSHALLYTNNKGGSDDVWRDNLFLGIFKVCALVCKKKRRFDAFEQSGKLYKRLCYCFDLFHLVRTKGSERRWVAGGDGIENRTSDETFF